MIALKTATQRWFGQILPHLVAVTCFIGAPEIQCIAGESSWFIYYTAGVSGNFDGQHLHVPKGSSADIWESTWSYVRRIAIPNRDAWAIDATVLFLSLGRGLTGPLDFQLPNVCYSKMNFATSAGDAVKTSRPTNSWEQVGAKVNEGPVSDSSCASTGYSLGSLELNGLEPLLKSSWTKHDNGPIFEAASGNYAIRPGHNGFFTAPSGNIYIVYHASPTSSVTCDGNRRAMVQAVG
ncbi:glycosyl hydrolase [Rhizoctonia solani]|nr:glycosyl hydrolase [Rhizoctonia solani]